MRPHRPMSKLSCRNCATRSSKLCKISLINIDLVLRDVGDRDAALRAADEAVSIRTDLVRRWPHLQPELDRSLVLRQYPLST